LDNAMGSGHFLVRATEWLADQIGLHPLHETKFMSIKVDIFREDMSHVRSTQEIHP
jgi:hypothetical protein